MAGLLFDKPKKKKGNKYKHMCNHIPTINDTCEFENENGEVCGLPYAETHEVWFGSAHARTMSAQYGAQVKLCACHHRDQKIGVHHNKVFDTSLKAAHQKRIEDEGISRSEFIDIFRKSEL